MPMSHTPEQDGSHEHDKVQVELDKADDQLLQLLLMRIVSSLLVFTTVLVFFEEDILPDFIIKATPSSLNGFKAPSLVMETSM